MHILCVNDQSKCMYCYHNICMCYDHSKCMYYVRSTGMCYDKSTHMYYDQDTCICYDQSTCMCYNQSTCLYCDESACIDSSTCIYYYQSKYFTTFKAQAYTMIKVHASTMTMITTCIMIIVHACTLIIMRACKDVHHGMYLAHSTCTYYYHSRISCPTELMFDETDGEGSKGRSPWGTQAPQCGIRVHFHPPHKKVWRRGPLEPKIYPARWLTVAWHTGESRVSGHQLDFILDFQSMRQSSTPYRQIMGNAP